MKYTLEIEINAPREKVFEALTNYENLTKWWPACKAVKHIKGQKGEAGASHVLTLVNAGHESDIEEEVITQKPAELFITRQESETFSVENRHQFSEENGKTKWTWEWEMRMHNMMLELSATLSSFLMGGQAKNPILNAMESFKKFVESKTI